MPVAVLALSLLCSAAPATKAPATPTMTSTTTTTAPKIVLPKSLTIAPVTFGATVTVNVNKVKAPAPRAKAPTPASLELGKTLYAQRCVLCHGDLGHADGVGARRIKPEPQHLEDVIWQGVVADDDIKKAILEGGAAVSRSPMMPANPDLKKKPKSVQALVDYVRSLRAPHGSVVATVTQADGTTRTIHGVADDKATATVVIPAVPKGATKILVQIDEDGAVGCTLDVVVTKDDVTLPCG